MEKKRREKEMLELNFTEQLICYLTIRFIDLVIMLEYDHCIFSLLLTKQRLLFFFAMPIFVTDNSARRGCQKDWTWLSSYNTLPGQWRGHDKLFRKTQWRGRRYSTIQGGMYSQKKLGGGVLLLKNIPNSRLECKNHTLFMIKMSKIDILIMTKIAEKTYPLEPHTPILPM